MTARDEFLDILARNRRGEQVGVPSICSAHPEVIRAALDGARRKGTIVLVESTSNQVDQYGGYTGMKPADFVGYVNGIADEAGLPREKVLFGGDHLGPNAWSDMPAERAMERALVLVEEYARAGYEKIHLDASMFLADDEGDRHKPLPDEIVAKRAAALCARVEAAWADQYPDKAPPVYIIGTEVPIPGGAREEEDTVPATPPDDARRTIEIARQVFEEAGLREAWQRVCGVVVQPGVEFGDDQVFEYQPAAAAALSASILEHQNLVFEAHSTDYQTEESLSNLVRDHFAILKVGPWLTFAFREAIFGLAAIEDETAATVAGAGDAKRSGIVAELERAMVANPKYWQKYYPGTEGQKLLKRKYSYSDRSRYYWPAPEMQSAQHRLYGNLEKWGINHGLLSQFLPRQYTLIREGAIAMTVEEIVRSRVGEVIDIYARACGVG